MGFEELGGEALGGVGGEIGWLGGRVGRRKRLPHFGGVGGKRGRGGDVTGERGWRGGGGQLVHQEEALRAGDREGLVIGHQGVQARGGGKVAGIGAVHEREREELLVGGDEAALGVDAAHQAAGGEVGFDGADGFGFGAVAQQAADGGLHGAGGDARVGIGLGDGGVGIGGAGVESLALDGAGGHPVEAGLERIGAQGGRRRGVGHGAIGVQDDDGVGQAEADGAFEGGGGGVGGGLAVEVGGALIPIGVEAAACQLQLAAVGFGEPLAGGVALVDDGLVHEPEDAGGGGGDAEGQKQQHEPATVVVARAGELGSEVHGVRGCGWRR